jgi:uncharacterized protein (TIGR00645 family)
MRFVKKAVQFFIIESRWMLMFFYIGLIFAQGIYCVKFCEQVIGLFASFNQITDTDILVAVLNLLDMLMIANLIKMIVSGSYQIFIERLHQEHHDKISSGELKVKMGTSLIGVSGINLLQNFLDPSKVPQNILIAKCGIHLVFLVSAIGLAYIEFLHDKGRALEGLGEEKRIEKLF